MNGARVISVLASLGAVALAAAQSFSFVVAGDGRAGVNRAEDRNGINAKVTMEIRDAVLRENATMLLWTGDLVSGYTKTPGRFRSQLTSWRSIMQPLYAKGVKVLACRGNHDAASKDSWAVWNQVFSGKYGMPMNGPAQEKGLTFWYEQGPVLILGLDQYQQKGESVDQTWVDQVLATHKKPFVFAMGHEPAFMDGAHRDTMDVSPSKRDAFWNSLIRAGSRAFFCGHDHLYDHMSVVRNGTDPGPEMHQFVAGTSGAPFYKEGAYTGNNTGWKLSRVKHLDRTYGYILVQIEGNRATITFKGRNDQGEYVPMDSWSYETGS